MDRGVETGRGPLRILYVDDDGVSRLVAEHLFASMGHAVSTSATGPEALIRLKTEPFDLLLTDVHMPEMDGLELLQAARGEHSAAQLPVVAVTADVMRRSGARFRELGFDGVIAKPLLTQALERVLTAVMAPPDRRSFTALGMSQTN